MRRIINTIAFIWHENMLGYLSLDIICSSKLTVFFELRSQKTVHFSEQIMSTDKYPSIFLCQMETIVYILYACRLKSCTSKHAHTCMLMLKGQFTRTCSIFDPYICKLMSKYLHSYIKINVPVQTPAGGRDNFE